MIIQILNFVTNNIIFSIQNFIIILKYARINKYQVPPFPSNCIIITNFRQFLPEVFGNLPSRKRKVIGNDVRVFL